MILSNNTSDTLMNYSENKRCARIPPGGVQGNQNMKVWSYYKQVGTDWRRVKTFLDDKIVQIHISRIGTGKIVK